MDLDDLMNMDPMELSKNRQRLIAFYRKERGMTDTDFRPMKQDAKGMTAANITELVLPKPKAEPFKRRF